MSTPAETVAPVAAPVEEVAPVEVPSETAPTAEAPKAEEVAVSVSKCLHRSRIDLYSGGSQGRGCFRGEMHFHLVGYH